MQFCDP